MSNQNSNQEFDNLKAMFSNYQKEKEKSSKKKSGSELKAKYFDPKKYEEVIRFLPLSGNATKPFDEAYFHNVDVLGKNGMVLHNQPVYCPARNNPKIQKMDSTGKPLFDQEGKAVMITEPCPLCEKSLKLLKQQDPSLMALMKNGLEAKNMNAQQKAIFDKNGELYKASKKLEAKLYYIKKLVDRFNQRDGIKFWRFMENFKGKGTYDLLLKTMNRFFDKKGMDFANPTDGYDFTIEMVDTPNPFDKTKPDYKSILSINYADAPSPLHADATVAKQWLSDTMTWRDVYKPKTAPNMSAHEYLVMLANGTNPYWCDSDPANKHWVFPGRPDLEELANTRNQDLTGGYEKEIKQASDLEDYVYTIPTTISNITPAGVGTFKETAMDLGATAMNETSDVEDELDTNTNESNESFDNSDADGENYDDDDLPF